MDFKKIFLKDACPTSIGGQAVIEGVMMRGPDRTAIAMRIPDGRIYLTTEKLKAPSKIRKIPFVRGVFSFVESLISGMGTLTKSADVQVYFDDSAEEEEPGFLEKKLGEKAAWNIAMVLSVIFALAITVVCFILLPTALVGWLGNFIKSSLLLNLIEGILRIILFVAYIAVISRMEDIKRVFEYHGAEHKTIHCFENGIELAPENAKDFYRLHPRCGTSFLMFVMVISLILFSLLGWPNLAARLISRLLLLPVVAGISYELLKWAGRSDNKVVELLSVPGLLLQNLTTRDPDEEQLEIAICALKAVLVPEDFPEVEGFCDKDANIVEEWRLEK